MVYNKTLWKDRVVERPLTFTQQNNADGTVTLAPAEGQIIEPGTSINAVNMNNIEKQYDEALDWAKGFGLGSVSKYISGDLNNLNETGFYRGNNLINSPYQASDYYYFIINQKHDVNNSTQTAILYYTTTPRIYQRTQSGGVWGSWYQLVTEAIPSWTSLPLQNGATSVAGFTLMYTKIGSIVFVTGQLLAFTNTTVFATLPVGFRPVRTQFRPVAPNAASAGALATIQINASGALSISGQTPQTNLFIELSFVAGQ